MQINNVYQSDPIPTVIVRVIAYTFGINNALTEVTRVDFPPPHINPRDISIYVPTPQVHLVRVYETPDTPSVGVLTIEYVATPSFGESKITPPLEIIVGGGRAGRDPIIESNGVDIPSIEGLNITYIEQRGAGVLSKLEDDQLPGIAEWTIRDGGGVDLLNGKIFYEGQRYTLFFEPYIDSSITSTIFDLTELIQAHIDDKDNPHEVNKADVGLSSIPNATSDEINLDDSNVLATSAAVNALRETIVNRIVTVIKHNLGSIPGSSDQNKVVVHNLNIDYDYVVIGNLRGIGGNWNADNDTFCVVRDLSANQFNVTLRNVSGATANLYFDYMIVKV